MNRKSYSLKKPSNRARMCAATAAVAHAAKVEQALVALGNDRNGIQALLCAVLAQKGGEVTITPGTIVQIAEHRMGFQVVPGPAEGELTLRLVEEAVEGENDGAYLNDDTDNGSGIEAPPEGEATGEAEGLCGDTSPVQGSGSGDGSIKG